MENQKEIKSKETNSSKAKNQSSDFIEKATELDQVSLVPVKSSDLSPAQVGNEKGSETAPAQTDHKQSDNIKEANSSKENDQKIDQTRKNHASDSLENDKETKDIQLKQNLGQLPPLSEFDIESDTEENHVDENISIKPKKKGITTWFTGNTPSQAKVEYAYTSPLSTLTHSHNDHLSYHNDKKNTDGYY